MPLCGVNYLEDRSTASQERDDEDRVFLVQFGVIGYTLSVDKHEACTVAVNTQCYKQTGNIRSGRHLHIVQVSDLIGDYGVQFELYEHPVSSAVVIQLEFLGMRQAAEYFCLVLLFVGAEHFNKCRGENTVSRPVSYTHLTLPTIYYV